MSHRGSLIDAKFRQLAQELYSPETTKQHPLYGAEYLLPFLGAAKLAQLQQIFKTLDNDVTPSQFIEVCAQFLHFPKNEKQQFVHGLLHLFRIIDMDGSGGLSWSELTQYLIDNFDSSNKKESKQNEVKLQAAEIENSAHEQQDKHFMACQRLHDHHTYSNPVGKMISTPHLHVLEQKSNKVRVFMNPKDPSSNVSFSITVCEPRVYVISFAYSKRENKYCFICSDMKLYFYECTSLRNTVLCSFYFDFVQMGVWYAQNKGVWLTAGIDGKIREWKFIKYTNAEVEENLELQEVIPSKLKKQPVDLLRRNEFHSSAKTFTTFNHANNAPKQKIKRILQGHTDVVTGLVEINDPRGLVSCGKDARVLLWDLDKMTLIYQLKSKGSDLVDRAFRGLDYSPGYNHTILSYGFETKVRLWSPCFSISRSQLKPLEGHFNGVVVARFVSSTQYCSTVDEKNVIRVWDIRRYVLVQLINYDSNIINEMCFIDEDLFVIGTKKLQFYDNNINRANRKQFWNDVYAMDFFYSEFYDVLGVVTKIDVRFYDGKTGNLKAILNNINSASKCIKLISQGRKLFMFNGPKVQQYHMKHFKKLEPNAESVFEKCQLESKHLAEACFLLLDEHNVLIMGDRYSKIYYSHLCTEGRVQLKLLSGGHSGSPIVSLSASHNYLVSSSANGIVTVWQLSTGKYVTHYQMESQTCEEAIFSEDGSYFMLRGSENLHLCGGNLMKIPGKNALCVLEKWFVSDSKGRIAIYQELCISDEIMPELDCDTQIEADTLLRRDQVEAAKHLVIQPHRKKLKKGVEPVLVVDAHSEQITQMRYVFNHDGLVTSSTDKTIKVWAVKNSTLVLRSHLNLLDPAASKWNFPANIIYKELIEIDRTLQYIENYQNSKFDMNTRWEIINRIARKIFTRDCIEQDKIEKEKAKANRLLYDKEALSRPVDKTKGELQELISTIEEDRKKKELRSKIQMLLRKKDENSNKDQQKVDDSAIKKPVSSSPSKVLQLSKHTQNNNKSAKRLAKNQKNLSQSPKAMMNNYLAPSSVGSRNTRKDLFVDIKSGVECVLTQNSSPKTVNSRKLSSRSRVSNLGQSCGFTKQGSRSRF